MAMTAAAAKEDFPQFLFCRDIFNFVAKRNTKKKHIYKSIFFYI